MYTYEIIVDIEGVPAQKGSVNSPDGFGRSRASIPKKDVFIPPSTDKCVQAHGTTAIAPDEAVDAVGVTTTTNTINTHTTTHTMTMYVRGFFVHARTTAPKGTNLLALHFVVQPNHAVPVPREQPGGLGLGLGR